MSNYLENLSGPSFHKPRFVPTSHHPTKTLRSGIPSRAQQNSTQRANLARFISAERSKKPIRIAPDSF